MIFEIRPAISEKGIEYYVQGVEYVSRGFFTKKEVIPLKEIAGKYAFYRYDDWGIVPLVYFSTPQQAAEKIRELYGTTATIDVVRL